jgi:hypothetical protein
MTNSEVKPGERVKEVHLGEDTLSVDLVDGRTIAVPYAWYPRLLHATPQQRSHWQVCGGGFRIGWPDIDEDLRVDGLVPGGTCTTRRILRYARLMRRADSKP